MGISRLPTRAAILALLLPVSSSGSSAREVTGPIDASNFERSATSSNGLYHFVSAVPVPKAEKVLPADARIQFTLTEAKTGKLIWSSGEFKDVVRPQPLPAPRADRVGLLEKGMSALQVLETLGAPDYVYVVDQVWEFEVDARKPYTLRLSFPDGRTVGRIQELTPPVWQRPGSRWEPEVLAWSVYLGSWKGPVLIGLTFVIMISIFAYRRRRMSRRFSGGRAG